MRKPIQTIESNCLGDTSRKFQSWQSGFKAYILKPDITSSISLDKEDQDHRQFVCSTWDQKPTQMLGIRTIHVRIWAKAQGLKRQKEAWSHPRPIGGFLWKTPSRKWLGRTVEWGRTQWGGKEGRLGLYLSNPIVLIVFLGPTLEALLWIELYPFPKIFKF